VADASGYRGSKYMIEPPTDRLHKFLAVGGIFLICTGITIPLDRFSDAKLQQIEASEKLKRFGYSYADYAKEVNKGIDAYNRWVKEPTQENERRAKEIIASSEAATEQLDHATRDAMIESGKQVDLMTHYVYMKNVWLVIGALCIGLGFVSSYYGFSRWLREPKKTR